MVFGTRYKVKKSRDVVVRVGGTPLQVGPSYKYLGFTLDSTLSFNGHVKTVSAIVAYKASLLAKIRKFITDSVAMKIYKSMIVPYFDYGDVMYNQASQEELDKLQRLQNKCLKICKGYNRRHGTVALHESTKVPLLSKRRIAHVNNFMYCRLGNPSLIDSRDIRTRAHDAHIFKVTIPNLEAYKRSIVYAGLLQWNNLPADTRNIKNFDLFESRQKTCILENLGK